MPARVLWSSLVPALLALLLVPAGAAAQSAPPPFPAPVPAETSAPRFAFAPVDGGVLKLDRETGRVSLCAKGTSGFACEAVPDSRDAYEAEIGRLRAEIDGLRQGGPVVPRRPLPPLPPVPGQPPVPPPGAAPSPDAGDLDRALAYAERFYRRLREMIDDLRAPSGQEKL